MCCIFTCCGWMIDLIQRAWVFAMSCCISSAICCVIMISSMSGVALGYNYSLAEYIDLKETNVSVYLKRGVFDDDVLDDMDWRRSGGHKGANSFARDDGDLMTQPPDESTPLRSGRRLDDSIMESDDNNRFEGSLMKLTAKPVHPLTTTQPFTSDVKMQEIVSQYPQGSLDQLKAIQSLISMRKAQAARDTTVKGSEKSTYGQDERYGPYFPSFPDQGRRMMIMNGPGHGPPGPESDLPSDFNPARLAVPDPSINEQSNWMSPKHPGLRKSMKDSTYPRPIIYNPGPIRPTRPLELEPTHSTTEEPVTRTMKAEKKPIDQVMDDSKEQLILDKYKIQRHKIDKPKEQKEGSLKSGFDYYEDDIKGLPVRRKRNINRIKRKVPRALHHKLKLPESASDKGKGKNSITNEISNYPSVPVRRLFRSTVVPTRKSLKSEMNAATDDINSTTDSISKIIQSMFS